MWSAPEWLCHGPRFAGAMGARSGGLPSRQDHYLEFAWRGFLEHRRYGRRVSLIGGVSAEFWRYRPAWAGRHFLLWRGRRYGQVRVFDKRSKLCNYGRARRLLNNLESITRHIFFPVWRRLKSPVSPSGLRPVPSHGRFILPRSAKRPLNE